MTTQAQVIPKFGEQTKAFSINELKRLIVAAKSMSDLDQAKRYLCSYFIPCADPHGVFWWDPDSKSLKHVIDKNIWISGVRVIGISLSISSSGNEVDNDDRRTVFLDVSPSRKGDLNYFKKLGDAMKYPGASEAFYAYLRAIANTYSDFNGNPPPMTTSKQEHIISTLPPLFQFIKDTYLIVKNYMTDLPVQEFYRVYTSYCETRGITPLSKINASRILSNELSTTEPPEKPLPEPDNYDVLDDLLSDSDFTTVNPAPEQQPEYPAESSASVTKPDPEPASEEQFIPEPDTEPEVDRDPEPKEGTRAHWAWQERHRWDRKPWVKNLKDQVFNDLYNTGKELWAKYQDASDEYDWEILAFEIEECPTTRIEDEYQYYLMEVVDRFKDWIEYNGYLPKIPSHKGKAREIPEERPKTDMEREWEAANGIIDDWDEEDTEGAINDIL
ncbi:hypothetical protein GLOIN_2v1880406 [Rhizophagus irregularis DAOM 181602=DAOM 197198]|nr:hypothetical protein GLOIN_2v1880406 [Rhizophagus irregularis DAOM 181602=DAOM 197198]